MCLKIRRQGLVRQDWRQKAIRVESRVELQPLIWYRSLLRSKDHQLGLRSDLLGDGLAWCGFPLEVARDWDDDSYGGLWYTNRASASAKCAECRRKGKEWDGRNSIYLQ